MAWEEPFAMGLALGYLLLIILEQRNAWLLAAMSAGLYLKIFYDVGLFMEAGLQVFYIVMAVYGFWAWGRNSSGQHLRIQRWPLKLHLLILAAVLTSGVGIGLLLARFTDAALPIPDSITTIGALTTTWMVARKVLENWLWWVAIDLVSIVLYLERGLELTALLFAGYVVLALLGWHNWRRLLRAQQ